jgi:hypothetical protein
MMKENVHVQIGDRSGKMSEQGHVTEPHPRATEGVYLFTPKHVYSNWMSHIISIKGLGSPTI